jgi:hypothetical protein
LDYGAVPEALNLDRTIARCSKQFDILLILGIIKINIFHPSYWFQENITFSSRNE